jgi:hypothetical protein
MTCTAEQPKQRPARACAIMNPTDAHKSNDENSGMGKRRNNAILELDKSALGAWQREAMDSLKYH